MNRYDKYRPANINWLDEVPEHWEVSKAKYYFKYTTGFTPPTGQEEFYNEGITWVTIADMNKRVVEESATTLSELAIEKYKPDLTVMGSLLYSFKLSVGKVAFAGKDLYTNEAIISILPDETYDVRYFYYTLPQQLLQNANENIYGAKMLNQELIRNAIISFPSKEEQIAISNYLDDKLPHIDSLISSKQNLIETLKEEINAEIDHAVTKGLNKDTQLKKNQIEWLGEIPEKWIINKIKYICKVQGRIGFKGYKSSDLVNEGEGAIVLGASHVSRQHTIDLTQPVYLNWLKYHESPEIMVKEGDVVFTQRGAYLGKVALIDKDYGDITINPSLILLKNIKINPGFLTFYLTSNFIKKNIELVSSSTAIPMISQEQLANFYIPIPPIEEQKLIYKFIQEKIVKGDETIQKLHQEIILLKEYRTALISEVVTGKQKVI